MNFAFTEEMLHCLQPPTSPDNLPVSVDANAILLGRQTSAESLPWQQQHLPQFHGIINTTNFADQLQHSSQPTFAFSPSPTQLLQYPFLPPANPTTASLFPNSQYFSLNGSPHFPQSSGFHLPPLKQSDGAICRTSSCPPHVGTNATAEVDIPPPPDKIRPSTKEPSYRKRKTDKAPNSKVISTLDDCKEKRRTKREGEVPESNNGENSTGTSKENSKVTEVQKPDYIHVRARRGQATDSHSLAERVRREKISERMKYLQDLVPGCNKITGKAGLLDEIINYVQSLQRQVEFLSMKLAAVNPRVDFNIDNFFCKEMSVNSLAAEIMASQGSFQFNFNPPVLVDHVTPCCGADMAISPPQEMALRRTTSAPLAAPDGSLIDSNFHFQVHAASSACWNVESRSHSLYKLAEVEDPGREPVFPPDQSIRGHPDGSNIKMEMSCPASRNF